MALLEFNRNPSRRELMWFGAVLGAFLAVVGALLRWRFHAQTAAAVLWWLAVGLPLLYYVLPPARRPLYALWGHVTIPIGWLLSHVMLAVVYYLVVTPVGLAMRVLGRDPMQRHFDRAAASYWVAREQPEDLSRYFQQF